MLAKIYRPAKSAMQSGKAGQKRWVLEFERAMAMRPEVLMGWTSATETSGQVKLFFDERDEAIAFARTHGIPHQVVEPKPVKRPVKAYGDNFAFNRKEPWSH